MTNDSDARERPARLGRYLIIDEIGEGAMGVVYSAFDPELDRKVALKLTHLRTAAAHARLDREARAMARVSHPNVVPIHDVGFHKNRLFIAMDYVDGTTLSDWLDAQRRRWQEVVQVFLTAAAGLDAAHDAGVVHRDFKPDNVLIDRLGRVQVADFGLALGVSEGTANTTHTSNASDVTRLTRDGAWIGTPAYMSPEQFEGGVIDARSDQFAFCVAFWEALTGERPFNGVTAAEICWAVTHGHVTDRPKVDAPSWLFEVLLRGISTNPSERWPSMTAIINAVQSGKTRARLRMFSMVLACLATLGGGVWSLEHWKSLEQIAECENSAREMDEVWSNEAKKRLHQAFESTDIAHAADTAGRVASWLDQHSASWRGVRIQACLNATVSRVWDRDAYDRVQWCLDERIMALRSLVDEFQRANAVTVQKAVTAVASLTSAEYCERVDFLRREPTPLAGQRSAVRDVKRLLSNASSLELTGRYETALQQAQRARGQATALGWPPLIAAALHHEGFIMSRNGDFEKAEQTGIDAYFTAARSGAWGIAADSAAWLVFTVGYNRERHEDGRTWARHAEVAIELAGDPTGLRELRRLNNLAIVESEAGEYVKSRLLYEEAIGLSGGVLVPAHPYMAVYYNNLATVYVSLGLYEDARALHLQALEIEEASLGTDHPKYADSLNNIAILDKSVGDYASAIEFHQRALDTRTRALGPSHPDVAASLGNLANVYEAIGEYTTALDLHQRGLEIKMQVLDGDHPSVAASLNNIGLVYESMGLLHEAESAHTQALAIKEKALGPKHLDVAHSLMNLAIVRSARGATEEPLRLQERALSIRIAALGTEHPDVADAYYGLGHILLVQARPVDAIPQLEHALEIYSTVEGIQELEPAAHFDLAKALVESAEPSTNDGVVAVELSRAWDGYLAINPLKLSEIEAWRKEHIARTGQTDGEPR